MKMSITISEKLLDEIDARTDGTRSSFIEQAVQQYLHHLTAEERDQNDINLIHKFGDELNDETRDALSYQVDL